MDLNTGSNIHSVRIKHFLGVLYDYSGFSPDELDKLIEKAKEREKQGDTRYPLPLDKHLNELSRKLS